MCTAVALAWCQIRPLLVCVQQIVVLLGLLCCHTLLGFSGLTLRVTDAGMLRRCVFIFCMGYPVAWVDDVT